MSMSTMLRNALLAKAYEIREGRTLGYGKKKRGGVLSDIEKENVYKSRGFSNTDYDNFDKNDPNFKKYQVYIKKGKEDKTYTKKLMDKVLTGEIDSDKLVKIEPAIKDGSINPSYVAKEKDLIDRIGLYGNSPKLTELKKYGLARLNFIFIKLAKSDDYEKEYDKYEGKEEDFYGDLNNLFPLRKHQMQLKQMQEELDDMKENIENFGNGNIGYGKKKRKPKKRVKRRI